VAAVILTNPPALIDLGQLPPAAAHLARPGEGTVNLRAVVDESGQRWGRLFGLAPADGPVYPVAPHRRPEAFVLVWDAPGRRPERLSTYGEAEEWISA
jgi:hypothetical protein